MHRLGIFALLAVAAFAQSAGAAEVTITMRLVNVTGVGEIIGIVVARDTAKGLKLMPSLSGLNEGAHGFHVHQNPDCGPKAKNGKVVPGLAAGSHYDPKKTGQHTGPDRDGHLGDLPVLYVDASGRATRASFAPRLKASDLYGRALVIHSGGDNYQDVPKKLGGGGARVACGTDIR